MAFKDYLPMHNSTRMRNKPHYREGCHCLSATTLPDKAEYFTFFNVKIDVADGMYGTGVCSNRGTKAAHYDCWFVHENLFDYFNPMHYTNPIKNGKPKWIPASARMTKHYKRREIQPLGI